MVIFFCEIFFHTRRRDISFYIETLYKSNSYSSSNIIFRNSFKLVICPRNSVISVHYFASLAITVEHTFVSLNFPIVFVFHAFNYSVLISEKSINCFKYDL
jgi:hypothetical protein